jgi:uncharacterized membrane protein YeiB
VTELHTSTEPTATQTIGDRRAGPDVARGAALIGVVVMNYLGYTLLALDRRSWGDDAVADFFDPWRGPLSTRFAAMFVLVAGVGVTLLTRRATAVTPGQSEAARRQLVTAARLRLIRRGAVLYVAGLALDEVWPGTILVYYGLMFVIAAGLFTLGTKVLAGIGGAAIAAAWAIETWVNWRLQRGDTTQWLTSPDRWSPEWFVLDGFVDGTHPLLPWLAFLCAGIVLGRALLDRADGGPEAAGFRWRIVGLGAALVLIATIGRELHSDDPSRIVRVFVSTDPFDRGGLYVASALGTALIAYALLDWAAERLPVLTAPLRRAGQLSLTLYLAHIAVFEVLRRTGWYQPQSFGATMRFALAFWVVGIAAGAVWQRYLGRGPAERLYRWLGG